MIGNCKRGMERLVTGGWRRHGFVCSLDRGRLMGVPNFPKRALLAGSGGIALETFLSQPVEKWVRG